MPAKVEGHKWLTVLVSDDVAAALDAVAKSTGRTVLVEAAHAIARHVAAPPVVMAPPLPPVEVMANEEPKRKAGRPRGSGKKK